MYKKNLIYIGLVMTVLLLSGCGGDSDNEDSYVLTKKVEDITSTKSTRIVTTIESYEYNGKLLKSIDSTGIDDGKVKGTSKYLVLEFENDRSITNSVSGSIDEQTTREYPLWGRLVMTSVRTFSDGDINKDEYIRDEFGNIIFQESQQIYTDGETSTTKRIYDYDYDFDAQGRPIRAEVSGRVVNGSDDSEVRTYTYDESSGKISKEVKVPGIIITTINYTWTKQ